MFTFIICLLYILNKLFFPFILLLILFYWVITLCFMADQDGDYILCVEMIYQNKK